MPSIRDVARHAEVSTATVSRVVNNDPSVRPAIRRIVLRSIAELGYVPNAAARGLRNDKTALVGFVAADLRSLGLAEIAQGASEVVQGRGYALLLGDAGGDPVVQAAGLRRLFERRVEGLLLYPVGGPSPELDLFRRAGIPVLVMFPSRAFAGWPQISVDLAGAMRLAVEHLLSLGHRRIALAGAQSLDTELLAEGYRQALAGRGLAHDPTLVALRPRQTESAAYLSGLVAGATRPTAVVAAGEADVPVLLDAIAGAGLRIPGDVSMVSIGDSPWADAYDPPITAVAIDRVGWGRAAAAQVFFRLGGATEGPAVGELSPRLVTRASTALPPDEAVSRKE